MDAPQAMNRCPATPQTKMGSGQASATALLLDAQAVLADIMHHGDAAIIRAAEIVRDQSADLCRQADAVATLAIMTGGSR